MFRGAVLLAFLLIFSLPVAAEPGGAPSRSDRSGEPARRFAFLVGVEAPRHPSLPKFQNADRDIERFAEVLTELGFECRVLTATRGDQDPRARPTAKRIRKELQTFLSSKKVKEADVLIVALCGPGLQLEDSRESYFCPEDATPTWKSGQLRKPETLIALSEMLGEVAATGIDRSLVFVDACRELPKPERGIHGITDISVPGTHSSGVLLNCSRGGHSTGHDEPAGGHGVFFHSLAEGLQGRAANSQGQVTWESLVSYVSNSMTESAKVKEGTPRATPSPRVIRAPLEATVPIVELKKTTADMVQVLRPTLGRGPGRTAGEVRTDNFLEKELVWCPPGSFQQDVDGHDPLGPSNEHPPTAANTTSGFWMARTEVTQSAWESVMGTRPWEVARNVVAGGDYPACNITCIEATVFCERLTRQDRSSGQLPNGWEYRLPREVEWEYACRAGSTSRYGFGDDPQELEHYAWHFECLWRTGERFAHQVGLKRPNAWGLFDMHGNVKEWCSDREAWGAIEGAPKGKAAAADAGRALRGGSWGTSAAACQCSAREDAHAMKAGHGIGFRMVLVETGTNEQAATRP